MLCYLLFLLLLLLLCTIACKLSLDLLFSAKWMQLCAISTEMLYYFFVFDELCVDEGDECCWFSVIVFIIKFWFLRYLSFSFKDSVFTDWFVVACWPCKSSIIFFFFIPYSSSLMKDFKAFSSAFSCTIHSSFKSQIMAFITRVLFGVWGWGNWCNGRMNNRGCTVGSRKLWFLK